MNKVVFAALCAVVAHSASAIELAPYARVFAGPEGARVILAPSADGKEALVQINGVNHPVDQVVFLTKLQRWGGGTEAFVTTYDGRDSGMVQKRASPYGGGERYVAYLPGRTEELQLSFEDAKSKALKPAALLATYERQQQQGVQQKLARFDRPRRVAADRERLERMDSEASAACGSAVKTSFDWSALDDERLKKISVSGYCGAVASGLERLCREDAAKFKPRAAALGQIDCQFGPELKARIVGQKVVFTTEESAPNQDDFVKEFLRNQ